MIACRQIIRQMTPQTAVLIIAPKNRGYSRKPAEFLAVILMNNSTANSAIHAFELL